MQDEKTTPNEASGVEIFVSGRGAKRPDCYFQSSERKKAREAASERVMITPAKPLEERQKRTRRKLRVAAYCRVSTPGESQVSSMENQKEYFIRLVQEHEDWVLAGIFADEGISGTNLKKRTCFNEMIRRAKNGKIDYIVIKDVARFSRNTADALNIARELRALDPPVGIYFDTLRMDTLREDYETILTVMSMTSQMESAQKSAAMLWSYRHRFTEGRFLCPTFYLLGYVTKDNEMVVQQDEARTVRLIFNMYLAGYTAPQIAKVMTNAKRHTGWQSKDENGNAVYNTHWTSSAVMNILRNERYMGAVRAQKSYTVDYIEHKKRKNSGQMPSYYQENHHVPIVSAEVYLLAQKIIASSKYRKSGDGLEIALTVIPKGLLQGFIPLNRAWAGSPLDEYFQISQSVSPKEVSLQSITLSSTYEFELLRKEYTQNQNAPMVTFFGHSIVFNARSQGWMRGREYVELLLHPSEMLLAVRPAGRDNPNAIHWADWTQGKCKPLAFGAGAISSLIYDLMNWQENWKFKAYGQYREKNGEAVLIFNLCDTTAYIPRIVYDEADEPRQIGWNDPIFPYEWREQIVGASLLDSVTACRMHLCDFFGEWDVLEKAVQPNAYKRKPPLSRQELQKEIQALDSYT